MRLIFKEIFSSFSILQESFCDIGKFVNIYNFKNILFPLLSLAYKEIISILAFFWIWQHHYSLVFFIAYSFIGGASSFLWGWLGDKLEEKRDHETKYTLIFYADLLLSLLFLLLFFDIPQWLIILAFACVDTQSNARSILATKKLMCNEGNYHEKSLFLNKLCWTAIFLCWSFFNFIKDYQVSFLTIVILMIILSFLIYPKKVIRKEENEQLVLSFEKKKKIHLLLFSFACFEAIFFLLWSFSERTHAPINFFAFTGSACLIGNCLSFFAGKEKEATIIRHMYLSIFCLALISFLVLYYFPSKETIFILYGCISMLSGIYLPYIFDEAMRIYGRYKRGKASGLVEFYNSCADISSSLLIKTANKFFIVSIFSSIFALIGYFFCCANERKQKNLE